MYQYNMQRFAEKAEQQEWDNAEARWRNIMVSLKTFCMNMPDVLNDPKMSRKLRSVLNDLEQGKLADVTNSFMI